MIEQTFVFEKSFRFSIFFVYVYTADTLSTGPGPPATAAATFRARVVAAVAGGASALP